MDNLELIEKFLLASRLEKNLSHRTLKAYRCDLSDLTQHFISQSFQSVTIDDLRTYLTHLESKGLSGKTIKRKLATIKVFYLFLEDEGLIELSPARKLKKKYRIPRRLPRVMSTDEIERLLRAVYLESKNTSGNSKFHNFKRIRDRVIIELLYVAGLRIDELVKIDIEDINLGARTLYIFGKGRKERLLYISSDEVIILIKDYLTIRNSIPTETSALILNKFGKRLSVYSIGNIFKEYFKLASISRNFTPHCLRHTMATMLMENGADVRSVQEILGHSSISTTEIYLAVTKQRKEAVLNKFNHRNSLHIIS